MTRDEKLKELINLFDFFKEYEKKREISEIVKIEMSESSKIHYKDALTKFVHLVNAEEEFKNDGSLEEHIEMKIWLIVNKYKQSIGGIKLINKINDIKSGDLIIIETVIDKYVGWVHRKDYDNKTIWISQVESLVQTIYFNFHEILSIKKLEG